MKTANCQTCGIGQKGQIGKNFFEKVPPKTVSSNLKPSGLPDASDKVKSYSY